MRIRASNVCALLLGGLLALGLEGCGGGGGGGGGSVAATQTPPPSPPPPAPPPSSPPSPAPPPPAAGPATVLNGDLILAQAHHHGPTYYLNPYLHFVMQNTGTVNVTLPFTVYEDGTAVLTSSIVVPAVSQNEYLVYPFGGIQPHDGSGLHHMTITLDPGHTIETVDPLTKWNDFICYYDTPTSVTTWDFTGANTNKPNVVWTSQGFHVHGQFQDKSCIVHYNVMNNSNIPTAAGTITLQRDGVVITAGTGPGQLMDLQRTAPMDMTYPALAPGQEGPQTFGVYMENNTTGMETWTGTINPGETDAYTNEKTRQCIVVNGLISTGFQPGSPFYSPPIQ